MFVFPPLPPKDYYLKRVNDNCLSAREFAPDDKIRVTLPEIAKYLAPIEATLDDPPPQVPFEPVNPKVVTNWVLKSKASYVPPPGKDDYLLHDIYKKYNVKVDDYDFRYRKPSYIHIRSFKYEIDCLEAFRLRKLQKKMDKEKVDDMRRTYAQLGIKREVPEIGEKEYSAWEEKRWHEIPKLFAPSQTDPCLRRAEFALIGQPFKHEACNWYYKNLPPPNIVWKPERFGK